MITLIRNLAITIVVAASGSLYAADEITPTSKPAQLFVTVEENVKLEVVDWGGSGRPLVLLAGLGNDIHVFDQFAPKLTPEYHVYGITRRGFGASSVPESGYSSERLGEDVIAVLNELKIERPILVGHSIAGSELSYIGTVYPHRAAALIYIEAAYGYAFYDESTGDCMNLLVDSAELRKKLEQMPVAFALKSKQLTQDYLTSVQQLERCLRDQQEYLKEVPENPKSIIEKSKEFDPTPALRILGGLRKYKDIRVPILALYAFPRSAKDVSRFSKATVEWTAAAREAAQAAAVEKGLPSAHVVRVPQATHYMFMTDEAEVLHEMEQFIGKLPPQANQPTRR
jgi:pimeloyl-ACP methyl ester carboxylesterase